jgi:hypothetical protein
MESRKHSRTISPEESAELEELVFDLVRERLLKAVGAGGMWTLQFRASTDTDSLFGETISEYIARDIANQIAAPVAAVEVAGSSVEVAAENIDDDIRPGVEEEIAVERTEWAEVAVPTEAELVVEATAEIVEQPQHDEHRMFKPRKAA